MKKVKGVIFDWAGTTVDFGCFAPVHAFFKIFEEKDIEITVKEAREPMGLAKIDHIRAIAEMPRVKKMWREKYGKAPVESDVKELYQRFETVLMASLQDFTEPLPRVLDTVKFLRKKSIKIGSTTGYTSEMMSVVAKEAKKYGYAPDKLVTPEEVGGYGRPYPYMIFKNMQSLELKSTHSIIKIGDTCSDIKEAVNAGVWAVGNITGSSEMGLSQDDFKQLANKERKSIMSKTEKSFMKSGADFTIEGMAEVPELIEKINKLLSEGKRPNGCLEARKY